MSATEWYVFPTGKGQPNDPTWSETTFRKVDQGPRELSESGAVDEVITSIAGHVSRAMLSRYSHEGMEAKRRALDEYRGAPNRRW